MNLPSLGLAAASTAHLVISVANMPAFAIVTVCCSIASCSADRSSFDIFSNSSIATVPLFANGIAPASSDQPEPPKSSWTTAAVSPTPDADFPAVYTPRGENDTAYFRSWDFASPGSPTKRMCISPLTCVPAISFLTPEKRRYMIASLT